MSKEYNRYLGEHFNYVFAAACWMSDRLDTIKGFGDDVINAAFKNICEHDGSKYSPEEYDPYDDYFYGERDEDAFNRAWLHHIHSNPHHWQHWVLMTETDNENIFALEMPKEYVFEMVADWWSFSLKSSNLQEIFGWYDAHRFLIILHPHTRKLVEAILDELREKILEISQPDEERQMTDSFSNIVEDVIKDDNITSPKCVGYLNRVKALYGDEQEASAKTVELPVDFYGRTINVGDTVRRIEQRMPYGWKPDAKTYSAQSFELWEDGWVACIYDEDEDLCITTQPGDLCVWTTPTLRDLMSSFANDYANDIREGGDGESVIDEYMAFFALNGADE